MHGHHVGHAALAGEPLSRAASTIPKRSAEVGAEPRKWGREPLVQAAGLVREPMSFDRQAGARRATGRTKAQRGQSPASRPRRGAGIRAFSADRRRGPSSPKRLLGGEQRPDRRAGGKGWMPVRRRRCPKGSPKDTGSATSTRSSAL